MEEYYHDLLNPTPYITPPPNTSPESGHDDHSNILAPDRDRPPQWTHDETKELLSLRIQLDQIFIHTKRNRSLWRDISTQLHQKGFLRTSDQCKSKWKNLVARYKGSENNMEGDANKFQFPFHEEMRKMFSERKGKGAVQVQMIEKLEDQEGDGITKMRKKARMMTISGSSRGGAAAELGEFIRGQMEMEERWMEEAEAREAERRGEEEEWRRWMEGLQAERMEKERQWREREDARRARADARAERRHGLVMAILDKLIAEKGGR